MPDDPKRYAIYARQSVSRDTDDSLSIEMQVRACQEYVARHGGTVAKVFEDPDQKGWKRHRPAFDAMLQFLSDGGADCVLVFKLSRFTRSLIHQETLLTDIAGVRGELVSVTEPYLNTSPMVRQILGAVNEQAKRDQSDFLTAAFAGRARRGLHHGYAPIGYRLEHSRLVIDEPAAEIVRQMFAWVLDGHGSPEIAHRLTTAGHTTQTGKPWSQIAVLRTLRRAVYAGHVVFRGDVVAHNAHPAIIDQGTFNRVQENLDRRRGVRRKASPSWADGFVYHACGARMYCAWWSSAGVPSRWRFRCGRTTQSRRHAPDRCTVAQASIFATTAEAWFIDALIATCSEIAPPDVVARRVEASYRDSAVERERQRHQKQRRLTTIGAQRDHLLDMALNGRVDDDVYARRDHVLKAETQALTAELESIPPPVDIDTIAGRHAVLSSLVDGVQAVLYHAPSELPALLHQLDVRMIVSPDGHCLAFGPDIAPFFSGI